MSTPKISVITPSVRIQGLKVNQDALKKQSLKNFEWLVCSKEDPKIQEATWVKDIFKGGYWTLNRAYNELFRHCRGEVVITMQDWIWASPDALQSFVEAIEKTDGGIISGVGDQYERIGKWGKPEVKIWSDPRKRDDLGDFYECMPNDIEWNFAAFPKKHIFAIGGMDEQLDFLGFGGDQLQVGERWDIMGYKTYLDQTNESFTIRHDRSKHGGQENWDKNHVLFNGKYDERKLELIKSHKWPVLDFLKIAS